MKIMKQIKMRGRKHLWAFGLLVLLALCLSGIPVQAEELPEEPPFATPSKTYEQAEELPEETAFATPSETDEQTVSANEIEGEPEVVQVASEILFFCARIRWNNTAVPHAYAVLKLRFSDLDGEGEDVYEIMLDNPSTRLYSFDAIAEENTNRLFNYVVEFYDEEDRLVGLANGGPYIFHMLDMIAEVYDADGNLIEEEYDYDTKGHLYYDGDSGDRENICEPDTDCLVEFTGTIEAYKGFSGFKYVETEINGTVYKENKIRLTFDRDTTVILRFRESEEKMPIHIDTGNPSEDYPNFAADLAGILNELDPLCDAAVEADGRTISLQINDSQNGEYLLTFIKGALETYDMDLAWSGDVLLSFKQSYSSYSEYNLEGLFAEEIELTENMTFYITWSEFIDTITLTVDPPVAGTEVTPYEGEAVDDGEILQDNGPHVVAGEDVAGKIKIDETDVWWCADEESDTPFYGTIEDGEEYFVIINLDPEFGYVVNGHTKIMLNGNEYHPSGIFGFYYLKTPLAAVSALPTFVSHSLTLNGMIGVNFFMDLPEIEGVDYEDSYMAFSVSGRNGAVTTDGYDANARSRKGDYFGFTRYVSSVQMADTITATFHYGPGWTVTNTYSVAEYVQDFEEEKEDYNDATANLIYALADYGHFVQPMLANVRGWVLGEDHAIMPGHTESYSDEEIANVTEAVSAFATKFYSDGSAVKSANACLDLDSSTTMILMLTVADGYEGEVTYYMDGEPMANLMAYADGEPTAASAMAYAAGGLMANLMAYTDGESSATSATACADGRFKIALPDITAPNLGKTYSIRIQASGEAALDLSPLSYANIVLHSDKYSNDAEMRNAMVALYHYYSAAQAY
ncbi:MAG: hypothetical protein Q4A32_07265 [Lachnospiraceae bacterium]|nr:hypothetical protein [Lachnospiraceae bacterium]